MKDISIDKLEHSLCELEMAVDSAREILFSKADTPLVVLDRLDEYKSVIEKQKLLVHDLHEAVAARRVQESARLITIINAFSALIREDARHLLNTHHPKREVVLDYAHSLPN